MNILARRASWLPLFSALLLSVLVTVLLFRYQDPLTRMGDWGYMGALVVEAVNSATVLFPAFGHAVILVMATSLNPWLLGVTGGVGAGLGELTGYLVGFTGHRIVARSGRVRAWLEMNKQWRGLGLFVFGASPLPFDVAGIWAGSVRYPVARFLAFTIAGKIVKVTVLAMAGRFGIPWLERLFG